MQQCEYAERFYTAMEPGLAFAADRYARVVSSLEVCFARLPHLVEACLEALVKDDPRGADAMLSVAVAAAERHPQDARLTRSVARAAITAGDEKLAARLVHRGLQLGPDDRDALLLAADLALWRKDAETAGWYLQRAALDAGLAAEREAFSDAWGEQREEPDPAFARASAVLAALTRKGRGGNELSA